MAVKNHLLDDKIIKAAKEEFMEYGFSKASLHKIAAKAGITTGALYTRYKGKDELFASLITLPIDKITDSLEEVKQLYKESREKLDVDVFIEAIKKEEDIFINMLMDKYNECVLLMCKSEGSNVEKLVNEMIANNYKESANYFRVMSKNKNFDFDAIELILNEQLYFYKMILDRGYTKEKVVDIMAINRIYVEAGWKRIFEELVTE